MSSKTNFAYGKVALQATTRKNFKKNIPDQFSSLAENREKTPPYCQFFVMLNDVRYLELVGSHLDHEKDSDIEHSNILLKRNKICDSNFDVCGKKFTESVDKSQMSSIQNVPEII